MASNRMVYHDGRVVNIEANQAKVKILSQSACAQCHAKGACTASDQEEKFIDAVMGSDDSITVGDEVTLVMEEKMGRMAVLFGFVLPLLVMVVVLFTLSGLGYAESSAALFGLGALVPYYLLLKLFRKRIEKDFSFKIEKKV